MIRQELLDKVNDIKNKLELVIDIKDPGLDRLAIAKEAYQATLKLETLVETELEAQRMEMSDINMMPIGEYGDLKSGDDFQQFKIYCNDKNFKPSNGKVLNDYMKQKGV